jgi:hypothetical protein
MPCADTAAARDHPHSWGTEAGSRIRALSPPQIAAAVCSNPARGPWVVLRAVAAGYSVAWDSRSPSTSGITTSGITTGRKISFSQSNSVLPSKPVQSQPRV